MSSRLLLCSLVIALLISISTPVLAQNETLDPAIERNLKIEYSLEEPDSGTAKVIFEFKNTGDDEINIDLSGRQSMPWDDAHITGVYDEPLGSLAYEINDEHNVNFAFSKSLISKETYRVVFESTFPLATQQTLHGWRFRQEHNNPFDWSLHNIEVSLTLPKGWYTLYDPIYIIPGAEIREEDFKKTVVWTEGNVEPGEGVTTVCEFSPKPHMYALAQTISIIIVTITFIYIFIVKKGFPAPMGFVRTVPGEDKPEKSNVIGAIETMMRDAKREVLITSPWIYYVDWFTSNVKQLTDRGVKVKILTWPSYERRKAGRNWNIVENKKQGFALSRFLAMFPEGTVRLNPSVHAKMIVVDREKVMTSSSNLTQTGLWENYEAGIWMEDDEMAGMAADYFNRIWMAEDTVQLDQTMFNPEKVKKALGWDW